MHVHNEPDHHDTAARPSALQVELMEHLPFSVSAVTLGLAFAGLLCYLTPDDRGGQGEESGLYTLFHLFHPMHMFFSAAATSAMFWRYDRSVFKSIVIGLIGSIGICGVSDIVFPQCARAIMGIDAPWHICVVEHPGLVLPFAGVGVLVGISAARGVQGSTLFSHGLHVLASTAASILYFIAPLSRLGWIDEIGSIFIIIVIAVMIPCCLSDIVFPLMMTREARARAQRPHSAH